jgi:hypothetical protein
MAYVTCMLSAGLLNPIGVLNIDVHNEILGLGPLP